jgi:hypothetical protein
VRLYFWTVLVFSYISTMTALGGYEYGVRHPLPQSVSLRLGAAPSYEIMQDMESLGARCGPQIPDASYDINRVITIGEDWYQLNGTRVALVFPKGECLIQHSIYVGIGSYLQDGYVVGVEWMTDPLFKVGFP